MSDRRKLKEIQATRGSYIPSRNAIMPLKQNNTLELIHGEWYIGEYGGPGILRVLCYNEKTGSFTVSKSQTTNNPLSDCDWTFKPIARLVQSK